MKLRNKRNGGIVDVNDALAERLEWTQWEPVQDAAPAPRKAPKKAAKSASGSDNA